MLYIILWRRVSEKFLHVCDTSHGTLNTEIRAKGILKVLLCISIAWNILFVTVYKALDEGLEVENTKYSVLSLHSYALAHYYILKTFWQ